MKFDAIILGGGLAGLGLAKQILLRTPDLKVAIIEKGTFPRPLAIAKVGESTVEIGSHYLAERLQLKSHLESHHIKKFGIRMFFGETTENFADQDELGASKVFGLPTYQIDRGILENKLQQDALELGVQLFTGAEPHITQLSERCKTVTIRCDGEDLQLTAKWLVDASGRAALLKNHLGLSNSSSHKAHAVWFRINRQIRIDEWSNDDQWHQRCNPSQQRWRSTNHLTGPGYWLWIIPLSSAITSIGIVMDTTCFNDCDIVDRHSALKWINTHQPRCAAAIGDGEFLDFVILQDYAYDCRQLLSPSGWAISGEAGRFTDPFYSPGTDFIAFANDFICDLICRDCSGQDIRFNALLYERVLHSVYENTLSLYVDQYGGFGDRVMMGLKLLWDYSYYWGVLSLLYFADALARVETLKQFTQQLEQAQNLNKQVQSLFRQRSDKRLQLPNAGKFINQYELPCLRHFNDLLQNIETNSVATHLTENIGMLKDIAQSVSDMLTESPSAHIPAIEYKLLGNYRKLILPELFV